MALPTPDAAVPAGTVDVPSARPLARSAAQQSSPLLQGLPAACPCCVPPLHISLLRHAVQQSWSEAHSAQARQSLSRGRQEQRPGAVLLPAPHDETRAWLHTAACPASCGYGASRSPSLPHRQLFLLWCPWHRCCPASEPTTLLLMRLLHSLPPGATMCRPACPSASAVPHAQPLQPNLRRGEPHQHSNIPPLSPRD